MIISKKRPGQRYFSTLPWAEYIVETNIDLLRGYRYATIILTSGQYHRGKIFYKE